MTKSAKKNRTRKTNRTAGSGRAGQTVLTLSDYVRRELQTFVIRQGMLALHQMLEEDREAVCGRAHVRRGADDAVRWGYAEGELVMGGRKVAVRKPRARKDGREVTLDSWAAFADEEPSHSRRRGEFEVDLNLFVALDVLPDEQHVTRAARRGGVARSARAITFARLRQVFGDPVPRSVNAERRPDHDHAE